MTWYSILHGPEFWIALVLVHSGLVIGVILGLWLAALLSANKEDDDDE